jgi:hypothetical protein
MVFALKFLLAIILTEAITEVVVKSEIFSPLRATVFHLGQDNKFFDWLHNLLDCGYCFSMWSGMLIAILFFRNSHLVSSGVDWFLYAIVLHRLSNLFHNIMDKIHGV